MMVDRIYTFLSLATKAGKVVSGEETCGRSLKSGKALLVIVSVDASDNTKKKFSDMCKYRSTDIRYFGEKQLLGRYAGKDMRSVVAVTDRRFAGRLRELIDSIGIEHGGV
ncbi:MAG: 50S ribosomal protein L7ae [Ruminiclostridium sp.]|nr:50S ribosomal protein L7ae [Ruminiclostridium sp.]